MKILAVVAVWALIIALTGEKPISTSSECLLVKDCPVVRLIRLLQSEDRQAKAKESIKKEKLRIKQCYIENPCTIVKITDTLGKPNWQGIQLCEDAMHCELRINNG